MREVTRAVFDLEEARGQRRKSLRKEGKARGRED